MANPYYTENFQGTPGQTARAEQVTTEFDGVQAGFDGVETDILRAIKVPSGEMLADLPPQANRANQWMKFNANGDPVIVNAPFNWRGFWSPNTLYFVGDVVQIGVHQSLVICNVQHTSGSTYAGTNWAIFIDLTGIQWTTYAVQNASTANPIAGDALLLDSSGGNIAVQLPVAALGDSPINLTHVAGSLASGQAITITAGSGQKIMGTTETTLLIDVPNCSMTLFYGGPAYGWRLRTMG